MKKIFTRVIEEGIKLGKIPRNSNTKCEVNFAALIHRDLKEETEAYALQILNHIVSKKTISEKFGYDYEAEQKQIAKEEQEESDAGFEENNEE